MGPGVGGVECYSVFRIEAAIDLIADAAEPAAVDIVGDIGWATSPTAYIPEADVRQSRSTFIYPAASSSAVPRRSSEFGRTPIRTTAFSITIRLDPPEANSISTNSRSE